MTQSRIRMISTIRKDYHLMIVLFLIVNQTQALPTPCPFKRWKQCTTIQYIGLLMVRIIRNGPLLRINVVNVRNTIGERKWPQTNVKYNAPIVNVSASSTITSVVLNQWINQTISFLLFDTR